MLLSAIHSGRVIMSTKVRYYIHPPIQISTVVVKGADEKIHKPLY